MLRFIWPQPFSTRFANHFEACALPPADKSSDNDSPLGEASATNTGALPRSCDSRSRMHFKRMLGSFLGGVKAMRGQMMILHFARGSRAAAHATLQKLALQCLCAKELL